MELVPAYSSSFSESATNVEIASELFPLPEVSAGKLSVCRCGTEHGDTDTDYIVGGSNVTERVGLHILKPAPQVGKVFSFPEEVSLGSGHLDQRKTQVKTTLFSCGK